MGETIRIIGIDPGLRRTGWGIVDTLGNSLRFVASGTVHIRRQDGRSPRGSASCMTGWREVIRSHKPDEAAVEQTFVNKDAVATLKLGQARGIAMLVPARAGLHGRRICAERGEEGGDRRRPWREAADPHDGERC